MSDLYRMVSPMICVYVTVSTAAVKIIIFTVVDLFNYFHLSYLICLIIIIYYTWLFKDIYYNCCVLINNIFLRDYKLMANDVRSVSNGLPYDLCVRHNRQNYNRQHHLLYFFFICSLRIYLTTFFPKKIAFYYTLKDLKLGPQREIHIELLRGQFRVMIYTFSDKPLN